MTKAAEYVELLDNLTATQRRCNELLDEARAARKERDEALKTAQISAALMRSAVEECAVQASEITVLRSMLEAKGSA